MKYYILAAPGHNRVYFDASVNISLCELQIAARHFSVRCGDFAAETVGGVRYITFQSDGFLTDGDISILSKLSFVYALFLQKESLFSPVEKSVPKFFDDDISSILRYTGKTNELFTRLMINVAAGSSAFGFSEALNLLDPVAGKGTTLFEGLVAGYNTYGVEIAPAAVNDGVVYLKRYLTTAKYKHTYKTQKQSGLSKSFMAERNEFKIARTKDDAKAGNVQNVDFVRGDSRHTDRFFKKDFFHLIVGDLPYGVQHGSVSNQKQSSFTRNPSELLAACLPTWLVCLKPGGAIALSWNLFILKRDDMENIFLSCGLKPLSEPPYNMLGHRVDQAINRDVIVARK